MRVARGLLKGALLVYVGYLVLFNAAFWSGAYEALANGSQDVVHVDLDGAYTVWPFVVRADRLHMTIDDDAVQIEILADDVSVDVHLSALRHRIVHMEGVRGRDYVFRLRRRRGDLASEDIETFAPMPRIERSVIREPDPNPDRDLSNNWNVRFDDVDAPFREIWIDGFRFRGQAHVAGGFYLRTEDLLRMPRSELTGVDGVVTVADRVLATVRGEAALAVSEIGFRPEDDASPLSKMTIESSLQAAIMDAGLVARDVVGEALAVEGGEGTLVARGRVAGGIVEEGSELDIELRDLLIGKGGVWWRSPLDLYVRGERRAIRGRLEAGGRVAFGESLPAIVLSRALVEGSLRGTDLRRLELLRGTLDVRGGGASVAVEHGEATVKAERASLSVQYVLSEDGLWRGAQSVAIDDARLRWGGDQRLSAEGHFFTRGRSTPDGLVVDRVKGELAMRGRGGGAPWQGELVVVEGYGTRAEGRIDATLALSSLAPIAALPPLERQVPDVAEAFLDLDDAEAVLRVQYDHEGLRLIVDEMEVDSGVVTGWLAMGDEPARGAVHVALALLSVGVTVADGQSDVTLSPDQEWLERYLRPGIERPVPPRPAADAAEPTN